MQRFPLSCLALCLASSLMAASTAQWICYPEPFDVGLEKPRYFRKDITVKNDLQKAIFYTLIDDAGWVQIDGTVVGEEGRFHDHYLKGNDVTPMLKTPGVHTLASQVVNMAGTGGLICRLELHYAEARRLEHAEFRRREMATLPRLRGRPLTAMGVADGHDVHADAGGKRRAAPSS